jgi:hypothetical protein
MVRQLPSWHENVGKRQVKAPKVFVRDSGMLHALLGLSTAREDLRLRRLWVVHAGERAFDLTRQIRALPLPRVLEELKPLG